MGSLSRHQGRFWPRALFTLGMIAVLIPGVAGILSGWYAAQVRYLPVIKDWEVIQADLSGLDQLVIAGRFYRRFSDDQCRIEWIRFYAENAEGLRVRLAVQAVGDRRRLAPDMIDRPGGLQPFGPIAIDVSKTPFATKVEGKTLHRCFELGPFEGIRMVSKLPDYDYGWLKAANYSPP